MTSWRVQDPQGSVLDSGPAGRANKDRSMRLTIEIKRRHEAKCIFYVKLAEEVSDAAPQR